MQLNANVDSLQKFSTPFPISDSEMLIYDERSVPLPAKDITFMHYHNCCELGVVLKGNGLFLVDDKIYSVNVGDIIFIPENVRHYSKSLDATDKTRCRFIYFDAGRLLKSLGISDDNKINELLGKLSNAQPIFNDKDAQYGALRRLADEVFENNGGDLSLCGVYFYEYLLKLTPQKHGQELKVHDADMEAVLRYMTLHFAGDIKAADLAKLCYLSISQLNRRFSNVYGISPIAWLNRFRLYSARELLKNTDYSISQVCEKTGFKNTCDLYRHFKAKFGVSPKQYRLDIQKHIP